MRNPNCGKCGMLNHAGFCKLTACIYPCPTGMGGYINKPKTNADRIRSMTDEELAGFMRDRVGCKGCPHYPCTLNTVECLDAWLQWSQEEIRI